MSRNYQRRPTGSFHIESKLDYDSDESRDKFNSETFGDLVEEESLKPSYIKRIAKLFEQVDGSHNLSSDFRKEFVPNIADARKNEFDPTVRRSTSRIPQQTGAASTAPEPFGDFDAIPEEFRPNISKTDLIQVKVYPNSKSENFNEEAQAKANPRNIKDSILKSKQKSDNCKHRQNVWTPNSNKTNDNNNFTDSSAYFKEDKKSRSKTSLGPKKEHNINKSQSSAKNSSGSIHDSTYFNENKKIPRKLQRYQSKRGKNTGVFETNDSAYSHEIYSGKENELNPGNGGWYPKVNRINKTQFYNRNNENEGNKKSMPGAGETKTVRTLHVKFTEISFGPNKKLSLSQEDLKITEKHDYLDCPSMKLESTLWKDFDTLETNKRNINTSTTPGPQRTNQGNRGFYKRGNYYPRNGRKNTKPTVTWKNDLCSLKTNEFMHQGCFQDIKHSQDNFRETYRETRQSQTKNRNTFVSKHSENSYHENEGGIGVHQTKEWHTTSTRARGVGKRNGCVRDHGYQTMEKSSSDEMDDDDGKIFSFRYSTQRTVEMSRQKLHSTGEKRPSDPKTSVPDNSRKQTGAIPKTTHSHNNVKPLNTQQPREIRPKASQEIPHVASESRSFYPKTNNQENISGTIPKTLPLHNPVNPLDVRQYNANSIYKPTINTSSACVAECNSVESDRRNSLLIQYGIDMSDLIIGSHRAADIFLSFYNEWMKTRSRTLLLFDELEKTLSTISSEKVESKLEIVANMIGKGAKVVQFIPDPKIAIIGKIVAVISDIISQIFKAAPSLEKVNLNEFAIMQCLQQDIEATSMVYMYGIQCDQSFQETCEIFERFHANILTGSFHGIRGDIFDYFLNALHNFNPKNHVVYCRRLQKCYECLMRHVSPDATCRAFQAALEDWPESVSMIGDLHWRFNTEGFGSSNVERGWEEICELSRSGGPVNSNDILPKIQECILALMKERSAMERKISGLLNPEK